eukprot:12177554-Karenia_brevis.AAC.1
MRRNVEELTGGAFAHIWKWRQQQADRCSVISDPALVQSLPPDCVKTKAFILNENDFVVQPSISADD